MLAISFLLRSLGSEHPITRMLHGHVEEIEARGDTTILIPELDSRYVRWYLDFCLMKQTGSDPSVTPRQSVDYTLALRDRRTGLIRAAHGLPFATIPLALGVERGSCPKPTRQLEFQDM